MQVIDEDGFLFGVVNVVDALVIVLVLGVVVAGLGLLVAPEQGQEGTRYVHIELEDQPVSIADRISAGDVMERDGHNLSIVDVYLGPSGDGSVSPTVLAKVEGRMLPANGEVEFGDNRIRPGGSIDIRTDEYQMKGTITSVDENRTRLDVSRTTVTVRSTVDVGVSRQIERGDVYTLAGNDVGTITSVNVFPTNNKTKRRVLLEIDLSTVRDGDVMRFGGSPVKVGKTLPFSTVEYDISGTIVERGSLQSDDRSDTVTAVVKISNLEPEYIDGFGVGDEVRSRGTTFARVTDKRVDPATVIVRSEDGNIYQREHPRNKDVYLTVELSVRDGPDGLLFHGERLQERSTVILDFETIRVEGSVVEIEDS